MKIGAVLNDPIILEENVYNHDNYDETGVILVENVILQVRRTTYELPGPYIHVDCLHQASPTYRSNWTTYSTPEWHFAGSEIGYTNVKISLESLVRVFNPQAKALGGSRPSSADL